MSRREQAERDGHLVRMDSLRVGTRFICISGQEWTFTRRDGKSTGVYHVRRSDGFESMFAGCAEVEVI